MTAQQLMDMPYAGMAEAKLRKMGKWHILMDDTERIEWIGRYADSITRLETGQIWEIKSSVDDDYDVDFSRRY